MGRHILPIPPPDEAVQRLTEQPPDRGVVELLAPLGHGSASSRLARRPPEACGTAAGVVPPAHHLTAARVPAAHAVRRRYSLCVLVLVTNTRAVVERTYYAVPGTQVMSPNRLVAERRTGFREGR